MEMCSNLHIILWWSCKCYLNHKWCILMKVLTRWKRMLKSSWSLMELIQPTLTCSQIESNSFQLHFCKRRRGEIPDDRCRAEQSPLWKKRINHLCTVFTKNCRGQETAGFPFNKEEKRIYNNCCCKYRQCTEFESGLESFTSPGWNIGKLLLGH